MKIELRTVINGREVEASVKPNQTLLEWLRDDLRLRGSRDVTYIIVSPMTSPAIANELRLYTLAGIDPIFVPVGEAALHSPAGLRLWSIDLPQQEAAA